MFESWFQRFFQHKNRGFKLHAKRGFHRHRFSRPLLESLEDRLTPTTYSVVSLADGNVGSGNSGTLRYILNLANSNDTGSAASPDLIQFTTGSGTISVGSGSAGLPLPALSSTEVALIDATTATGYAGAPRIVLNGASATAISSANGLTISGGSSTVKGLEIIDFSGNGIQLDTNGSDTVQSCYIGITAANVAAANGGDGILIVGTPGNTIGGTAAGEGNVLSGNGGDGIAIAGPKATGNVVAGNWIGTDIVGKNAVGNTGNGISITAGASANTIGNSDPVSSITYNNADAVGKQPVSAWQGIRNADTAGQYLIVGTSDSDGLLFDGSMAGVGTSYTVDYPNADTTSIYGPDNEGSGHIGLVGTYKNSDYATAAVTVNGFLFQGTTNDLSNSSDYQTIDYPGAKYNFVHSTMGGLAVGNYDSAADHGEYGLPLGPGQAYVYNIAQGTFSTNIVYPNSLSDTAYGIWYNGNASYTICGGYSLDAANNFGDQNQPIGQAFLVDYNSTTGIFTNWASFSYPYGANFVTHFEGISSVENGVYTLNADSVQAGSSNPVQGSWLTVRRNTDGSFGTAAWVNLNYPNVDPTTNITSSNSVYGNQVVGVVIGPDSGFSYQATINIGFQLSNVIGGNGGNGIEISAANDNQVAMNYIGTDKTGTIDLGNALNGILMTAGAASNLIGGEATGGNNPRADPPVFATPPLGNLISGNDGDGVLIDALASQNQLSGNFIGTTASGDSALGNGQDGVAIDHSNGNSLIGCTFQQDPFVFYNVIDGNGGNGLRVSDSDYTTIQANFFGVGADNQTAVGNAQNGVLIEGDSSNTVMGGPIPLGNVDAANGLNGILVQDTASIFTSYNTFCGLAAFQIYTNLGNGADGMKFTTTGANILIRTNVITENGNDGIEISGAATGVRVAGNIIGLDTNGNFPMGNKNNGVEVDGKASGDIIGGPQPTFNIIAHNVISANGGDGVAIDGAANNILVSYSYIGTELSGQIAKGFGNAKAGVFVGPGTASNTIGAIDPNLLTLISGNLGAGIQIVGSDGNTVIGTYIGTDFTGKLPIPNLGNGILLTDSSNNVIGGAPASNTDVIAFNALAGIAVDTGTGNSILGNSLFNNGALGIVLVNGGNVNQTAPILTAAFQPSTGNLDVSGTLIAAASSTYTIQFFTSSSTSPGQAQTLLGTRSVTTDAHGVAVFVFRAELPTNAGTSFTATATDAVNDTSAISAAVALGGNANTIFVASNYGLLLNRAPDPNSVGWVNPLNAGASPSSVVLGFEASQEYLQDQVVALYLRYLNRAPDSAGEQNWVGLLEKGSTFEQVSAGIVGSQEYFQDQGSTNEGYVTGLYEDVLNRTPTTAEVDGWVDLLKTGTSRVAVASGFLTSTEYYTQLVQSDYTIYLGRPAEPAGVSGWVHGLQTGSTDQEVLAMIFGSPEGFGKWS